MGSVPDGIFDFIGNTIRLISKTPRPEEELHTLSEILREAQAKRTSKNDVLKNIESKTQNFGPIVRLIADTKGDLYAFIGLILTIITMYLQCGKDVEKQAAITVDEVLERSIGAPDSSEKKKIGKPKHHRPAVPKVGRNEKCPCGSGKKYKRCHGEII